MDKNGSENDPGFTVFKQYINLIFTFDYDKTEKRLQWKRKNEAQPGRVIPNGT